MSSEESYRAILRYLTNEREPYAPGTEGNVKRKIRKAAACYVVRGGTLYYQRRQRHRKTFAELEVVLQPERRRDLIEAAHLGPGGTHHTRHQTWHYLSKTYWWRGETWLAVRGRAGDSLPGQGSLARPVCAPTSRRVSDASGRRSCCCQAEPRGWGTRKEPHFPQEGGRRSWGRVLAQGGTKGASPEAGPAAGRGRTPGLRQVRLLGRPVGAEAPALRRWRLACGSEGCGVHVFNSVLTFGGRD